MDAPFIHKNKEPLCYGYLIADKIGFKVAFDFIGTMCFENPIGNNLIDFAWIDPKLIETIFEYTAAAYVSLREKSSEYETLADGIIDFINRRYMHINVYLSMYLFGFIELFLEGRADGRVLSNISVEEFEKEDYSDPQRENERFYTEDAGIIDLFMQSITERQALVAQTLSWVLSDENKAQKDALSRFYEYECSDPLFRELWHSRFEVSFGVITDGATDVVQLSALARIDDMLRYELVQTLIHDVQYKHCQSCGKLFIPTGRSDSLYCSRIMPGQEKPCNQIGANLVAKKKVEQNPALKLYRQAYHRLSKRVEFGYMEPAEFAEWKELAVPKREQCLSGVLSLEEFIAWIDNTSRQR